MHRFHAVARVPNRLIASSLRLALGGAALLGGAHPAEAQMPEASPAAAEEPELPHAFFTHMGLPEGVGVFNFRTLGLATRADGGTDGDFAFHLETGLTRLIGLHIRNDRFLDSPRTEAMFQFAAFVSKDGMRGFAPIIEFEFPTKSGAGSRIQTLVGFTSTLGGRRAVFNQVLHYNPREDGVDASAAVVFKLGGRVFPVVELLGEGARGAPTVVNLLGGLKVRVREWLLLGLAVQFPLSNAQEFSWQGALGPDVEWTR
jgi:hypothetical protein